MFICRTFVFSLYIGLIIFSLVGCTSRNNEKNAKGKPNILLLVADDLGYADLGCFGSDIHTPNIDQLASEGIRFSHFYSAPSCAPTRASLLTGADNHMAGMGSQFHQTADQWGYEGFLSDRIITIPQLLSKNGYQTYMVGKWHLGGEKDQLAHEKGFQKSFIMHQGAGNHYNDWGFVSEDEPSRYSLNGDSIGWPENAYSTDLYTEYLLRFIKDGINKDKPFFAFAAYTSPHWPMQVDTSYWKKYEAQFASGYEVLRKKNLNTLKKQDIIEQGHPLPPLHPGITPWDSLSKEEQKVETRKMALYAGMLENLDHNVGRLIQYLKESDEYDNTMIIFMGDNGAAYRDFYNSGPFVDFLQNRYDNSYENMGTASSFISYGPAWAEAGSAPFRYYKQYTFEGGIRVPLIIKDIYKNENRLSKSFVTLTDLAPTFYDLADANYPDVYKGKDIHPLKGKTLVPLLRNQKSEVHNNEEAWIMEHHHHVLVRQGKWKLVNTGMGWEAEKFELYDIISDPSEKTDIKAQHPEKYEELLAIWRTYKSEYRVIDYSELE